MQFQSFQVLRQDVGMNVHMALVRVPHDRFQIVAVLIPEPLNRISLPGLVFGHFSGISLALGYGVGVRCDDRQQRLLIDPDGLFLTILVHRTGVSHGLIMHRSELRDRAAINNRWWLRSLYMKGGVRLAFSLIENEGS